MKRITGSIHESLTRLAVLVVAILAGAVDAQQVIFVAGSASPGGDGAMWETAFDDFQDGLSAADSGDEIWVAAGVYTPALPGGDPAATFLIPSGVGVFGGFGGDEVTREQRDPSVNVTILSGDINQDDPLNGNVSPNSYHVVTMAGVDSSTRLDGFEVQHGVAFSGTPQSQQNGAGLLITNGEPTVANCGVSICYTRRGGGVYASSANATFENCRFSGNIGSSWAGAGGAMYVDGTSVVTIRDSSFIGNEAEALGGWSQGGAIYTGSETVVTVERCTFTGNVALHRSGGGIDWCRGGAIFSQGNMLISHCRFSRNISNVAGGVQSWASPPNWTRIWNSTFTNNDAIALFVSGQERDGAAGTIAGGGELEIIGCAVHGGFSDNYGGAWVGAGGKVSGSVFWNNTDSTGNIGRSNIRADGLVEYSCVQNMFAGEPGETPPDPADYPGSISLDPLFVNAVAGDFRLRAGSPCIDAGNNGDVPFGVTTDLDGRPRFLDDPDTVDSGIGFGPIMDMGAYEFGHLNDGDVDGDGDVDLFDFGRWQVCVTGPEGGPVPVACDPFDVDNDTDVDLADYGSFQQLFDGGPPPLNPPGSITGLIVYQGADTGLIHVTAASFGSVETTFETTLAAAGPYVLNVDIAAEYFVSAFIDSNGNGALDDGEPASDYLSNPVGITEAGQIVAGVDISLGGLFSISGTVTQGVNPLFGTTLTLSGASDEFVMSDSMGDYRFTGLATGDYTVTPSRAGRYFYPFDAGIELLFGEVTDVDFEARILPFGEVDGQLSGIVSAVDPANYNLTVLLDGGGSLTLFVYVETIFSGAADTLEDVQVGFSIQSEYFTSGNLAVEIDVEP